jgi:hypothetical protein
VVNLIIYCANLKRKYSTIKCLSFGAHSVKFLDITKYKRVRKIVLAVPWNRVSLEKLIITCLLMKLSPS